MGKQGLIGKLPIIAGISRVDVAIGIARIHVCRLPARWLASRKIAIHIFTI